MFAHELQTSLAFVNEENQGTLIGVVQNIAVQVIYRSMTRMCITVFLLS